MQDGGPRRWQDAVEPDLRRRVLENILANLVEIYEDKPVPSVDLNRIATSFEERMFTQATSKDDYIKKITLRLLIMKRNRPQALQDASASGLNNQHVNMGSQMQPANHIETNQGSNTPVTTTTPPQGSWKMSIQERQLPHHMGSLTIKPSSSNPVPKQHVAYPVAQTMNTVNGQADSVTRSEHILESSLHAIFTTPSSGVSPSQLIRMQPGESHNKNKLPVMQMQSLNISSSKATNVAHSSQEHVRVISQPLIANNQERSLHSVIPQAAASTGSVEEVDWREEMFQQMKPLKGAYLSKLVEIDELCVVPKLTKEQFESLPKDKSERYKFRVYMKKRIRAMLKFLHLQKSEIPEHLRGQLPLFVKAINNVLDFYKRKEYQMLEMDDTGRQSQKKPQIVNTAPSSGCTSSQQRQPLVQPAPFQLRQNTNSEVPRASMKKPASSENVQVVCALMPRKKVAVAAASNGSTTDLVVPSSLTQQEETTDHLRAEEDVQHTTQAAAAAKNPMDRLIHAVRSSSTEALRSSADAMRSVISMDDYVPDMELNTFQDHWTFSEQAGNKMKRIFEVTAWDHPESLSPVYTWDCEVEENAKHYGAKKHKIIQNQNAVLDEIESVNSLLIDTIASIIADEDDENGGAGGSTSSGESAGTLIKLSYMAVSLAPDLKSLFATSEMPIVMPAKLLVPADYPRSSPVLLNEHRDGQRRRNGLFSDISISADVTFRNALQGIPEPRSIRDMVRAWDTSVRLAVTEFAQRFGGGTFSSSYGRWESCF